MIRELPKGRENQMLRHSRIFCSCKNFCKVKSSVMGKFSKLCANKRHNAWRSNSPVMINLKAKVCSSNVFFKAFNQRNAQKPKHHFCTDCLREFWKIREYTCSLPENYEGLPSYTTVSKIFETAVTAKVVLSPLRHI